MKLHTKMPRPIVGWPLAPAIALDKQAPGFLVNLFEASHLRRQSLFAVFSTVNITSEGASGFLQQLDGTANEAYNLANPMEAFARALCQRKCRDLVRAAFGSFENGLMGALGRIGGGPLDRPHLYRELVSFFQEREHRAKARTLRHVRVMSSETIKVLRTLDPLWVSNPHLVDMCSRHGSASGLNEALRFIRSYCSGADDHALRRSIKMVGPASTTDAFFQEWFRKADRFPTGPEIRTDRFRPLSSATDMIEAGRRFRNCLGKKIRDVLLGRYYYLEWAVSPGAVVELKPLSDGRNWLVEAIYGHDNTSLHHELLRNIRADLCDAGLLELIEIREDPEKEELARTLGLESPLDWLI
ncbi:hypothetical protein GR183_21430 [Stappia sp. GBMRC 2046]|uniref:Uncharacterized protein n=1 Tax=Stappia sediminis TaxID=2692190 RepID=A0A7X3LYK2_9HYPH|nr:hypothetical protein [Stappia sediminis]MXN67477.1 hypothetical protein [Stappia sediminis]